jgi:tripartite-type tricarboxylate transporter receptor subunit TctC
MPSELRERIAVILGEVAAADPVIATRLAVTGQIVNVRGPAEFAAAIEQQRAKLAEIAKILGIKSAQ